MEPTTRLADEEGGQRMLRFLRDATGELPLQGALHHLRGEKEITPTETDRDQAMGEEWSRKTPIYSWDDNL